MIRPKYDAPPKPTKSQETDAYELATIRDNNTCVFRSWDCDRMVQRDHRQNRQSGNTVVSNLQLLCLTHHQRKTENPEWAIREGWGMPRHTLLTPAQWPARRYLSSLAGLRLTWVLYGDDGSVTEISAAEARARMNGAVK